MIKLIIFDKDGTLIEFANPLTKVADDVVNEVTTKVPIQINKAEISKFSKILKFKLYDSLAQSKFYIQLETNYQEKKLGKTSSKIYQFLNTLLVKSRKTTSPIIEGGKKTIINLKKAGYKLAIVSSDNLASANEFLIRYQMETFFDVIVTRDLIDAEKPDPLLIQYILDQLEIRPDEAIMVGDTLVDIQLAKNANLAYTIGVLSGSGNAQDLQEADFILENLNEIPSKLPLL